MDESVYDAVSGLLADKFMIDRGRITPDVSIVLDLEFDSLDEVQFARALEKAFEVEIGSSELTDLDTLAEIVDLVAEKRAAAKPVS